MGIADPTADMDPFCLTPMDLDAVFALTTKRPHNRTRNHNVLLYSSYTADVPAGTLDPFTGAYPVPAVDSKWLDLISFADRRGVG